MSATVKSEPFAAGGDAHSETYHRGWATGYEVAAERLASGVKAGIILRLIAGNTDQTYTPTEVSVLVGHVVDEQLQRTLEQSR